MLDCFWDSKHLVTPEAFRSFCNDTVPLLRFTKFVWQSNEVFHARAEIAHYGKGDILHPEIRWSVCNHEGQTLQAGRLHCRKVAHGGVTWPGEIDFPLSFVQGAMRLTLTLEIAGTAIRNRWNIWVYPASLQLPKTNPVWMTTQLDNTAVRHLRQGGTVFLSAPPNRPPDQPESRLLKTRFLPVFWSFGMFKKQPGTMGVLCDPQHPALASFPTDMHSNWQWWELTEGANAFILNDAPPAFRPLIQVVDDFHRNYRLGMVIETQVERGKLLATSLCMTGDMDRKPVTRQLFYSLLQYVAGDKFHPKGVLEPDMAEHLFANHD